MKQTQQRLTLLAFGAFGFIFTKWFGISMMISPSEHTILVNILGTIGLPVAFGLFLAGLNMYRRARKEILFIFLFFLAQEFIAIGIYLFHYLEQDISITNTLLTLAVTGVEAIIMTGACMLGAFLYKKLGQQTPH